MRLLRRAPAVLALLTFAFLAAAPASQQPEALSNAQPDWDTPSQSFIIGYQASRALADSAVSGDYVLLTSLTVRDRSGATFQLGPQQAPVRLAGRGGDRSEGIVSLEPQVFAWDRDGQTVTGPVVVSVSSELRTSTGDTVRVFGYNGAVNGYTVIVN